MKNANAITLESDKPLEDPQGFLKNDIFEEGTSEEENIITPQESNVALKVVFEPFFSTNEFALSFFQ